MALVDFEISEVEELQQLETVRVNHDEAYLYISQALSYKEQHQYSLACDMYVNGLEKIDKAINIRCDRPYCHGLKWDNARKLQQKMRKTAQMIKSHLRDIQNRIDSPQSSIETSSIQYTIPESFEQPPSYEEYYEHKFIAVSKKSSRLDVTDENSGRRSSSEIVQLFSVQEDVMLFYVANDGSSSTTFIQSPLHIYKFTEHDAVANYVPPAWLQIGSWTYPLVPGQSPVLESGYGAFLFPNVVLGQGSAVGVILPPTVNAMERAEFLSILNSLTAFRGEGKAVSLPPEYSGQKPHEESFSEILSKGIVRGAEYLSAGLVKQASSSSELIHNEASKARQKINPKDKPVVMNPHVKEGVKISQEASGVVLKATGFLVNKLADLTVTLGKQVASHAKEQGSKLCSSDLNEGKSKTSDTMEGMLTVASGGLQGFSTMYSGLEEAAKILACSLSQETVNAVDDKYGNDAAKVVENALHSVGNVVLTTHNVQSFGEKAVAERTAKDTGKAFLKVYTKNGNQNCDSKTINNNEKLSEK